MTAGGAIGIVVALAFAVPLAWKWQLGIARAAGFVAAAAIVLALVTAEVGVGTFAAIAAVGGGTLAVAAAVVTWRFYRDPERTPPERDDVVVSPADGEVVYVRRAREGVLPVATKNGTSYRLDELTKTELGIRDAIVVGVALNFLDVHVNRAPIAGTVALQRRFPGSFGSLRRPETIFENERATIVIDRGDLQLAVVLIASRLVRRIVAFVRERQVLVLGERIGAIRFGSQVDLVLPARDDVEVVVRPGDHVRAGETVVAVIGRAAVAHGGAP